MNKECPHCGVDDFRLWDLFRLTLKYADSSECRNCGGLVRNSGWGQFLTLLATAVLVVFDLVLLSPFVPDWVVFPLLITLIPLPLMVFAKPVMAVIPTANHPPFIADPNNDKAIIVSGWGGIELGRALDDFRGATGSPLWIEIEKRCETRHRLTFPEDIPAADFTALINYLNYPIDLGSPEREITVAGTTTLHSAFTGIPASCWGQSAILYIPEPDEDHDVVYLRAAAGAVFANSLNAESGWRHVDDPRLPSEVSALTL